MDRRISITVRVAGLAWMVIPLTGCSGPLNRDAAQKFENALGNRSFVVHPTVIRERSIAYDLASAKKLAHHLEGQSLGQATISPVQIPIHGGWGHNQARMFRESVADFAATVKGSPPGAYFVMAECLMAPDHVIGAHLYVVDSEGRMAYGILVNDHHGVFRSRAPKTVGDCVAVLEMIVENELGKKAKAGQNAASKAEK